MDLPPGVEDYVKETIELSLGLPVSDKTLQAKLLAAEHAQTQLRDRVFWLQDRLKEKDAKIQLYMAEASLNAQAVKKQIKEYQSFMGENDALKSKCEGLLTKCELLNQECCLYERDREVLMEFGNEAAEQVGEAKARALKAEESENRVAVDLEFYKCEYEILKERESKATQELYKLRQRVNELECMRSNVLKTEDAPCSKCCLLKNKNEELQLQLLASVSSKDYIAKVTEVATLQKDKEHLRINLCRAEEEVKLLFEENKILDEENKLLMRLNEENKQQASGGKDSSSKFAKGKRKSSPQMIITTERTLDFDKADSPRMPLLPLQQNSPECRKQKK